MTEATTAPIRVRIAPSPTGDPHVGTAYIGLLNYHLRQASAAASSSCALKTPTVPASSPPPSSMIFDALRWIGLTWDEGPDVGGPYGPYRQSERTEIYREHVQTPARQRYRLQVSFETAEELEALRKSQLAAKLPPRYNGAHRELTAPANRRLRSRRPSPTSSASKFPAEGETAFRDELRGEIKFSHNNVDDQVLMKSDGFPTYHLANVVDDHLMHITDVIRCRRVDFLNAETRPPL